MNIEILETKISRRKHEISLMASDMKVLNDAGTVLEELGYNADDIFTISSQIRDDIRDFSDQVVKMDRFLIRLLKEQEGNLNEKNKSNK